MKVEYINPFVQGACHVFSEYIGGDMEQGQLAVRTLAFTTQQISIAVGVSGQIHGQVIYGMSPVTAMKIASAMIGSPRTAFDEVAVSAISELGNLISGHATRQLAAVGLQCDLAPPAMIQGMNVEMRTTTPALVVPLYTKCGKIEINVALTDNGSAG